MCPGTYRRHPKHYPKILWMMHRHVVSPFFGILSGSLLYITLAICYCILHAGSCVASPLDNLVLHFSILFNCLPALIGLRLISNYYGAFQSGMCDDGSIISRPGRSSSNIQASPEPPTSDCTKAQECFTAQPATKSWFGGQECGKRAKGALDSQIAVWMLVCILPIPPNLHPADSLWM